MGYRFSLHRKDLPGCPDIVMPKYNTVIFVHGCIWHGHVNCAHFRLPKTRRAWWKQKIWANLRMAPSGHKFWFITVHEYGARYEMIRLRVKFFFTSQVT